MPKWYADKMMRWGRRPAAVIDFGRLEICGRIGRDILSNSTSTRRGNLAPANCGESIVSRFGGRAIAAVAVWVGLAMLGYGPRAAASFLPFATQVPQSSPWTESGGAGS